MEAKTQRISILMYPRLAHGHISPFFELAKKLSLKSFQIYFCPTQVNLKALRDSFHMHFPSMQPVELELPFSFQELPPHYHTTKNLPPHLMSTLRTAFDQAKPAFCNILKTIRPDLVIYDFMQPWVPEPASELNIKAVLFFTCGAASRCSSFFTHNYKTSTESPIKEIYFIENEIQRLNLYMQEETNGIGYFHRNSECMRRSSSMVLIKTTRDIEAKYINYLSDQLVDQEIVTVGPLVQEPACKEEDEYIMNWLSQKGSCSVVYVSFGSEYFLSNEEMEEIANGLELSQANFICVVRFHKGDNRSIHEALPQGFLRRVEKRGLVVEGWAPQAKILSHSSIGGFVSHCGWGSTLESIVFGVPIIALPMHYDQPINAKLVVDVGVGMEVPRKNGTIDREELAKVINLIMATEEGKQVKKRAKELSKKLKEKGDEELDLAVEKLLKLVKGIRL